MARPPQQLLNWITSPLAVIILCFLCSLETAKLLSSALGVSDAESGGAADSAPQYVNFKEEIRGEMVRIRSQMNELRGLHGRAALSKFEDTREDELHVEVLTQQITRMFRSCEERLRRFGSGPSASRADERVKQNVQRTLAVELQRLSAQFRRQQKDHLGRLRDREAQLGGGGRAAAAAMGLMEGRAEPGDVDPGFADYQTLQIDSLGSLVNERDREVTKIVSSINELATIMKDLSVLVIDQGKVLDRIDYQMEVTAAKVEEGVGQLRRAERTQRRSRATCCIMLLLAAIGFLLLIIMFKAFLFG
jgi:syntaxin 16